MARAPWLLVGGLGFIGEHLAYRLRQQGLEVLVLARRRSIKKRRRLAGRLEKAGVQLIPSQRDFITAEDIEKLSPAVVYHLAGKASGSWSVQWEAHVGLAEQIVQAATRVGARIVYVSSIAVASDAAEASPGEIITEHDVPPGPEAAFETIHAETKATGERVISSSGGRWVIVRPGLVYGPGEAHSEVKLLRTAAKLRVAPISRLVPIVHVVDVADILSMAGHGGFDGKVLHLVSKYTLGDLALELCSGRCLRASVDGLLSLGRLAPRSSKLRLAWSLVRRRYRYRSRVLQTYPWRLGPV
ncbi:MAG: NAD(P)-dependent oxidoreductase [Desulfurococcales archaeon]|nr:NAD(P)-dependent oxidoreductase [Desulfurococcales archaeon]